VVSKVLLELFDIIFNERWQNKNVKKRIQNVAGMKNVKKFFYIYDDDDDVW